MPNDENGKYWALPDPDANCNPIDRFYQFAEKSYDQAIEWGNRGFSGPIKSADHKAFHDEAIRLLIELEDSYNAAILYASRPSSDLDTARVVEAIKAVYLAVRERGQSPDRGEDSMRCYRALGELKPFRAAGNSTLDAAGGGNSTDPVGVVTATPLNTAGKAGAKDWTPPDGYVGVKTIKNDPAYQKAGKNPPRTTMADWANKDGIKCVKDPANQEVHYPIDWVLEHISKWNPRGNRNTSP